MPSAHARRFLTLLGWIRVGEALPSRTPGVEIIATPPGLINMNNARQASNPRNGYETHSLARAELDSAGYTYVQHIHTYTYSFIYNLTLCSTPLWFSQWRFVNATEKWHLQITLTGFAMSS